MRQSSCKDLKTATFTPRSAASFEGALASGYGSYLLPLRLRLLSSQAILFSVRLKQEVLSELAIRTHSPSQRFSYVFRVRIETFRRG